MARISMVAICVCRWVAIVVAALLILLAATVTSDLALPAVMAGEPLAGPKDGLLLMFSTATAVTWTILVGRALMPYLRWLGRNLTGKAV